MIGDGVRVRLVSVTVNPAVVVDDGENLTPTPVTAMTVPAARIDELPALLRAALGELQTQLDANGERD